MTDGIAFAGTTIEIDGVTLGQVTSFELTSEINEEEVSGSEDVVGAAGAKITAQKFKATAVGKTASIEGIALNTDTGQSDLEDAADTGLNVTLRQFDQEGKGYSIVGFFTNFTKQGSLPGVYTFTSSFRVNSKSAIDGSAS